MKAIKAATDPGDIARNESGSTILYNEHGCGVHIIHSDGSLQTDINLLNIDGDDWTPLCPAVDMRNTEREKELEEKVRELEHANKESERNRRNCYPLGEPLEPGTHVDKNTPLFKFSGEQWWPCMWGMDIVIPARCHGEYYLDPRPLPTLPEPEESSLVKRLKSLQRRASGSYDDHVRVDSGTLAQVLKEMEEPKE